MSRDERWRLLLVGVALAGAGILATRLRVTTDITHFMPRDGDRTLARISRQLADSENTRTIILALEANGADEAAQASGELQDRLRGQAEIASLRGGPPEGVTEAARDLYLPRRGYFASEHPDQLHGALDDDGLRRAARRLKSELASPMGALVKALAPEDPLLLFTDRLQHLFRAGGGTLVVHEGRFLSADRRHAILFIGTRSSPFKSAAQAPLQTAIQRAFDEVNRLHGGGLHLLQSSIARIAVDSERRISSDVSRIFAVSSIWIVVLFLLLFRSLRLNLLALLPPFAGALVGNAAGAAAFGQVHGLTLAMGSTLIGIAMDYPIHLMSHQVLQDDAQPRQTLRRIWTGLMLGALTTVVGFVPLFFTSFAGIREIALVSCVGVMAALWITREALPPLMKRGIRPTRLALAMSRTLTRAVLRLRRRVWLARGLLVAGVAFAAVMYPRIHWADNLSALNRIEPQFLSEMDEVRRLVGRFDEGRLVVASGPDLETALQRNDAVHARLEQARQDGLLQAQGSLHELLWSRAMQEKNREAWGAEPDLGPRLKAALVAEGFRPAALTGMDSAARALARPEVPPLELGELLSSPLGELVRPFRIDMSDQQGVLTFVRGVTDPAQLAGRLADVPGVLVFDQSAFLTDTYRGFRKQILNATAAGLPLLLLLLWYRYRKPWLTLAAATPAVLAAVVTLPLISLAGGELNLFHVVSILLILGMGVDYGVFLIEAESQRDDLQPTILSVVTSCITTILAFGLLALSSVPVLRAIGLTSGVGILLSLLLAPAALALGGRVDRR